jgi:hypothetical protein
MANEKSRNHEPRGGDKAGSSKKQGKRDSDKQGTEAKNSTSAAASRKPGPGKQPRDQLTVRAAADAKDKAK